MEPDEYMAAKRGYTENNALSDPTLLQAEHKPALTQDEALVDAGQGFLALEIHPNQLKDSFLITSDTPLTMQRINFTNQTSEAPFPPDRFVAEPHPDPENVGPFMASKENTNYPERARALVYDFIKDRLEKTDNHVTFSIDEVYTVWFCKTLKNWKGLFSTTLPDGMYYEVTYDGDKGRAYIDKYTKVDNVMVLDSTLY